MPVEIKELVIKAVVSESNGSENTNSSGDAETGSQETLVQLCVDRVLEILREKNER